MKNNIYWKDKKVLIIGGSSGLGKNLALQLDQVGAKVLIVGRRLKPLEQTAALGKDIKVLSADISDKNQTYLISTATESVLGDVDVLINCASYLGETPLRELMDTSCEDFEQVLQTNLLGPFRLIKAVAAAMRLKKSGMVVNISSDAAVSTYNTWGSYSASKAALDKISEIFGEELKNEGIRFFSIDPGDMNTPMHLDAIPDADVGLLKSPRVAAEQLISFIENDAHQRVRGAL